MRHSVAEHTDRWLNSVEAGENPHEHLVPRRTIVWQEDRACLGDTPEDRTAFEQDTVVDFGRDSVKVLGAFRHGHVAGADLSRVRLRAADKLLLEGPADGFRSLSEAGDVTSVTQPSGRAFRRRQAPIAIVVLLGIVILAALNVMPIGILALIAEAGILLLRCIENDEAWQSVDGSTLVLTFAMLIIGAGREHDGAVALIVDIVTPLLSGLPPFLTLIAVYFMASDCQSSSPTTPLQLFSRLSSSRWRQNLASIRARLPWPS